MKINSSSETRIGRIGYESKDIAECVRQHEAFDREDRAAWKKPRMAEIQAEAGEKKRKDEIHMAQIDAATDQAKIQAEKTLP